VKQLTDMSNKLSTSRVISYCVQKRLTMAHKNLKCRRQPSSYVILVITVCYKPKMMVRSFDLV
jgi:hypothetical protein